MLGLGQIIQRSSEIGKTASIQQNDVLSKFKFRVTDDGGTAENYACLQADLQNLTIEPAPFTTGILEFYPGAAAAYSLRQLRRSVFPYAIRVRRSSDSTEQDIGFNVNGELDTNALLAFAGSGDAFVSVWYDQSSNGNDATQSTEDSQPQIVSSGVVVTENGKPALLFDGSDDFMTSGDYIVELSQNSASVFSVSQTSTLSNNNYMLSEGDSVSPYSSQFILGGGGVPGGTGILWVNTSSFGTMQTGQHLTGFDYDQTNFQAYIDGAASGSAGTATVNAETSIYSYIGRNATTGAGTFFTGKIQELITYKSDQSSNRTGIETNVNDFYSIYS